MLSGDRQVWLAEDSGHLVGVASTSRSALDNPQLPGLELSSIYVDATAHGSGIAAELLGAAITTEPAHLWVFASNPRAQRFYAKHGFHANGETRVDPDTSLDEERWLRTTA
ncbi:MAG: GNAT family N-acetyltransferase [Actinomycetota bacterium]|nr:GNAT family N-acetyltransferase [Actinomycetota bacterium]